MDDDLAVLRKMENMKRKRSRTFDSVINKRIIDKNELDEFLLEE